MAKSKYFLIYKMNKKTSMTKRDIRSAVLMLSIASLAIMIFAYVPSQAFADVSSPKKQIKMGIDQTDIICKASMVKVYRINADSVACVTPSSAQKLIEKEVVKEIPKDRLDAKKSFRQSLPIGTVTELATVKQFGDEGKTSSKNRVAEYVYVFEVCAKDKTIRAPEVLVRSDSETKTVKIAQKIMSDKCYTSSAKVKAAESGSISASLTNKGMITDKITELEAKVADIQQKLATLKKSLSGVTLKDASAISEDEKENISDTASEISKLRKELNLAKGELNKYLFALHSPPQLKATEFAKQKMTFTGVPLKDTSVSVMSVTKQVMGSKNQSSTFGAMATYNVVFEACAGKDVLRAPEVRVSSDSEEKVIRIAERIISNSCQMSTAKINAEDTSSIELEVANRSDISAKITKMEKKIDSLKEEQLKHQTELNRLVSQTDKSADYQQKVIDISSKIIQLRNEIRDAKFQMFGSMYEVYKNP